MFLIKNNKSAYYQIVYFVDGKRTTHSTKKKVEKEANQYLEEFSRKISSDKEAVQDKQITRNIKSVDITPINKNILSLSKFRDEYFEYSQEVKSQKYIDSINFSFRKFISFTGDIPINEVTTRIVDKFINHSFGRTKKGAHLFYRTLKAAFNKALEWNYIPVNPFVKVKFPKLPKTYPVFITENELLIILTNTIYQHLKDIFTVAFYTGLRLSELINMKWNWIDFFKNQITVRCTDEFLTKSKKERIIPMCEKVRSVLINRYNQFIHQQNEVVFYRRKGKKLHADTISKQFKQIIRTSNLNNKIHFHTLRHSFASILVQRGVSLYVVKELLGHEDLTTTQIYSHLQNQNLTDAVNLL